jgi:hypothetical protein
MEEYTAFIFRVGVSRAGKWKGIEEGWKDCVNGGTTNGQSEARIGWRGGWTSVLANENEKQEIPAAGSSHYCL